MAALWGEDVLPLVLSFWAFVISRCHERFVIYSLYYRRKVEVFVKAFAYIFSSCYRGVGALGSYHDHFAHHEQILNNLAEYFPYCICSVFNVLITGWSVNLTIWCTHNCVGSLREPMEISFKRANEIAFQISFQITCQKVTETHLNWLTDWFTSYCNP